MSNDEILLKPVEAAKMLNVSPRTLWTLSKAGKINVVKIGVSVRYTPQDIRTFVAASRQSSSKATV